MSAFPDSALGREDLHGFLCARHLPGLLLPGQPHPGCSGHGLWGAESGNHRWGLAEGEGVSAGYGAPAQRAKSKCSRQQGFLIFMCGLILKLKNSVTSPLTSFLSVSSWQQKDKHRRRTQCCPQSCLHFVWRQAACVEAAADEEDRTGRCQRKRERKLLKRSLTHWMSQWYINQQSLSAHVMFLLQTTGANTSSLFL